MEDTSESSSMISSESEEEESRYDFHEGTDEEEEVDESEKEEEDESCSQTNVVEIKISDESNEDESNENKNKDEAEENTVEATNEEKKRLNRLHEYFCGWSLPETNDSMVHHYFRKMKGDPKVKNTTKRKSFIATLTSFIASFLGIGLVAVLHFWVLEPLSFQMIIGSFGASAVLIYGELKSPLAQPRNFVGGHFVSALVGTTVRLVLPEHPYIASPLAVALAVCCMQWTRTTHPPGGATALIAVMSSPLPWYGYMYVFMPVLSGCLCMLLVALVVNNFTRKYPVYWI